MTILRPNLPRAVADRPVLVIVGHGSPHTAESGHATIATAVSIARQGRYRAVPALMKGEPSLPRVLHSLPEGSRVFVVPHFAGDGVFATDHIPTAVAAASSHLAEARVLPALGGSRRVIGRTAALLTGLTDSTGGIPDLLVVGHGSSAGGDTSAEAMAFALGGSLHCGAAHAAFLERAPTLAEALDRLPLGPDVLMSVLLAARGKHACKDVPDALGLPHGSPLSGPDGSPRGPIAVGGRRLWLHAPLTDIRLMTDAAVELAEQVRLQGDGAAMSHPVARPLDHNQGGFAATA
jgi:sirohydrochlorin cobaltochelatase